MNKNLPDPKISFPCDYPIKVLGIVNPVFHDQVCDVVALHDPTITNARISQKISRKGKYVSISFQLYAISKDQIDNLFTDLKKIEAVKLVL